MLLQLREGKFSMDLEPKGTVLIATKRHDPLEQMSPQDGASHYEIPEAQSSMGINLKLVSLGKPSVLSCLGNQQSPKPVPVRSSTDPYTRRAGGEYVFFEASIWLCPVSFYSVSDENES
jgi:hypothetical protein